MSAQPSGRIDRFTAERLLRREPVDGQDALADLLSAAAVPARDGELAGEPAAVAAFRNTRQAAAGSRLGGHAPARRPSARLLSAKAAAIAVVAVTALGGVALAARDGMFAEHNTPPMAPSGSAPESAPSMVIRSRTSRPAPSRPAPARPAQPGTDGPTATGTGGPPSPSLVGLCHAYGAGDDHGKKLQSPPFRVLVDAAGGTDRVPGYCAALLADQHPGHPGDEPNGHGDDHGDGGNHGNQNGQGGQGDQ
jgi:hypothetical protein